MAGFGRIRQVRPRALPKQSIFKLKKGNTKCQEKQTYRN